MDAASYAAFFRLPAMEQTVVTTTSEEARRWCRLALAWLFGFHQEEAASCFRQALAAADEEGSSCAFAAWGLAYCQCPDYNAGAKGYQAPFFCGLDGAEAALEMLATAEAEVESGKLRGLEAALVKALRSRFSWESEEDYAAAPQYAEGMSKVFEEWGGSSADACALFAEAVITQKRWALYEIAADGGRQPRPASEDYRCGTQAALDAITQGLHLDPGHPGCLHFLIHLAEEADPPLWQEHCLARAADGKDACRRLRDAAGGASHLCHMPGHIYCLAGDWQEAVAANREAVEAGLRYMQHRQETGKDIYRNMATVYRCHDRHMLLYAAMFAGDKEVAMASAVDMEEELLHIAAALPTFWDEMAMLLDAFIPMRLHVMVRFGDWPAILAVPPMDEEKHVVFAATWRYARGVALAVTAQDDAAIEAARSELAALQQLLAAGSLEGRLLFNNSCQRTLKVGEALLEGELLYRQALLRQQSSGDTAGFAAAWQQLEAAVRLGDGRVPEDELPGARRNVYAVTTGGADRGLVYDEPWGWMQPARHALGALCLEQALMQKDAALLAKAEEAYRQDLGLVPFRENPSVCPHPKNVWSLKGLVQCLEARSELGLEEAAREELAALRRDLDELPASGAVAASCECSQAALRRRALGD